MNRIERLMESFRGYISVPWREDAPPAQRVVFCIYNESDELMLRKYVDEFELATKQVGYDWALFDLTDSFAEWLCGQKYAKKYFEQPSLISTLLPKYLGYMVETFKGFLEQENVNTTAVVAVLGAGSLFGLIKVKDLVDELAPLVKGRLLVFFPGTYESNNYRLLNGYDGWNYMAVPITADKQF